ncbi:MAG TPA: methyltransferase domain-containing protein [Rhizomicrobium sp.]
MKHIKEALSGPVFKLLGYRPQAVSVAEWDREYRDGQWKFLETMSSLAGLASILGYCQFLAPDTILDVGCGAGLLAAKLKVLPFKSYLGIDIAPEAVAQAIELEDARTAFVIAAADGFETGRRFDVVVFNQCINYFADPGDTVARYAQFLEDEGRIIVSLCDSARGRAAWPLVERHMIVEDAMTYIQSGGRGTTKVLRPRGG